MHLAAVNKEVTTFDRFLVLGIPSSPHVMTMFLKTPAATKLNLKLSQPMSPGSPLYVIMPRIVSFLSSRIQKLYQRIHSSPCRLIPSSNFTPFLRLMWKAPISRGSTLPRPLSKYFKQMRRTTSASGHSATVRPVSCLVPVPARYQRKSGFYHSHSCVQSWPTLPETKWSLYPKLFREFSFVTIC